MSFNLPRFNRLVPLVDDDKKATLAFHQWWQSFADAIEEQVDSLVETIDRIRRLNSHTVPTTILRATEDGATVSIEVLDHTRVYGDGTTLAIVGNTTDGVGLLPATLYGCYYIDTTLEDTNPTFVFTTDPADSAAAVSAGRHGCGVILTPALSSGDTIDSGGSYPGGSASIGGELL